MPNFDIDKANNVFSHLTFQPVRTGGQVFAKLKPFTSAV
jgi:hypothetical protein